MECAHWCPFTSARSFAFGISWVFMCHHSSASACRLILARTLTLQEFVTEPAVHGRDPMAVRQQMSVDVVHPACVPLGVTPLQYGASLRFTFLISGPG